MLTNLKGRFVLIVLLVAVAIWELYPPQRKLKGGIDLVGGASLIYEIDDTDVNLTGSESLAEQMIGTLRKRVDPEGLRNLIWRTQGRNRIQIIMPRPSAEVVARRDAYKAAQEKLDVTNLRFTQLYRMINAAGAELSSVLASQVHGVEGRRPLLEDLAAIWEKLVAVPADSVGAKEARFALSGIERDLVATNIDMQQFGTILELGAGTRDRKEKLAALREAHSERIGLIDEVVEKYDHWSDIRGPLDDVEDLKRLVRGAGVLEFRILVPGSEAQYESEIKVLRDQGPRAKFGGKAWYKIDKPEEFATGITAPYGDDSYVLAFTDPEHTLLAGSEAANWSLRDAQWLAGPTGYAVTFEFDERGSLLFENLTRNNVDQPLCILLDNVAISAPNIRQAISGRGEITGNFSQKEVQYLSDTLKAGSLPARLKPEPISVSQMGSVFGEDNLNKGFKACVYGLVVVMIFMVIYYMWAGLIANVALALNVLFLLSVMVLLGASFTLPGIAGVILTVGIAVDANVLIFERIREESSRGTTVALAIRNGYEKAFSTIFDANLTTMLTAVILYYVGSEEVKGFALTLGIGIALSMFTALFVTRAIFSLMTTKRWIKKIPMLRLIGVPNIDWIAKRYVFWPISLILMIVGAIAFYSQGDEKYDIDFRGGTTVEFQLSPGKSMAIGAVRERVDDKVDKDATVVEVGNSGNRFEVTTTSTDINIVSSNVVNAFSDVLDIQGKIAFTPFTTAQNDEGFFPIQGGRILGSRSEMATLRLPDYEGGVVMIFDNLNPPQTPENFSARLLAMRQQPDFANQQWRPFETIPMGVANADAKYSSLAVAVHDPNYVYNIDPITWRDNFAQEEATLIKEALNSEQSLQRVVGVGSQIAGKFKQQAIAAIILSLLVIVGYIWIRFGSVRFGLAAIAALVHDVLIAVGLIAGSAALAGLLGIEQFKFNLTMIAAILTLIGYSLNDTIVVFDRIRENRGKLATQSAKIINDSINQTLSRTLLTGLTTLIVLVIMYVAGGGGIKGFAFCMMVGVFVGTYSSIAIASPILLAGGDKTTAQRNVDASDKK